ncbi:tRNA(Ile)-lysidine synthase [Micrococcales bacterium KH10]|nr:tRNA(Ile)-lysidine synthase [Micrococcales bacterium KH10]
MRSLTLSSGSSAYTAEPVARRTALDPLRRAVEEHLRALPPRSRVLVACSGGADSLALAAATINAASHLDYQVGAVIVDHGLQPGSDQVATTTAQQCRVLGIEHVTIRTVDIPTMSGGGPEARARTARYQALERAAEEWGAVAVLLGHTLDDQAETVLLGLTRGAGMRSLAGMRPVAGLWHRPLLQITRNQTESVCAALGLDYWVDPTNAGTADDPLRSRLRSQVMPVVRDVLGESAPKALARTAALLQRDLDYLDACAEELFNRAQGAVTPCQCPHGVTDSGGVRLDIATLKDEHAAVRTRTIHHALTSTGSPAGAISLRHVAMVDELLTHWHGQGPIHLPGQVRGMRHCGTLEFIRG